MITLTQLKQYLNISTDEKSKDALLNGFIAGALSEINSLCSRRLDFSSHAEISSGTGGITLVLGNYPVTAVESIEKYDGDTWEDIFVNEDKVSNSTLLLKDIGIIKLLKSYIFPKGEYNIRVTYSAGYKWADLWQAGVTYGVDDVVNYDSSIYKCTEEHTSQEVFDESKWELDPAKPVPEALAKAATYLAAKQFYESPAGKNLFMKSSETFGDKQTQYKDIDILQIVHSYMNINS